RLACTCTLHRPFRPLNHASSKRFLRTPTMPPLHFLWHVGKTLPKPPAATQPRRARDRNGCPTYRRNSQKKNYLISFPAQRLSTATFQLLFALSVIRCPTLTVYFARLLWASHVPAVFPLPTDNFIALIFQCRVRVGSASADAHHERLAGC